LIASGGDFPDFFEDELADGHADITPATKEVTYKPEAPASESIGTPGNALAGASGWYQVCIRFVRIFVAGVISWDDTSGDLVHKPRRKERSMKPLIGICLLASITATADAAEWKLVWSDEFDRPGLPDPAKWGYETGYVRNHEKQFYTRDRRENARVEGGMLIIEARKERYPIPAPSAERAGRRRKGAAGEFAEYTSAALTTDGKAAWNHGRIEVRAKLPSGRGTWPAIWTLGTDIHEAGWPRCGEIDIMEHVGFDPGTIHANAHTAKYNHIKKTNKGDRIAVADASEAFHVYAIEWDERKIDFFVDDRKYFTYTNEGTGRDAWPFDREQYLILNLAIGGDWGGQKGIDDRIFPQRCTIDYVRVYRRSPAGE
jgi:beta-glucanase (GH16 family)